MIEPKVIPIGECKILLWRLGHHLITQFADGLQVPAAANYDQESVDRAIALGYRGDTWAMSRDHEICHSLLMVALGHPWSPVLRGVAVREAGGNKEDVVCREDSDWEEAMVMSFQRFVQTGVKDRTLRELEELCFDGELEPPLDLEAAAAQLREMTE